MKTLHYLIVLLLFFVFYQPVQSQAYKFIEQSMNNIIKTAESFTAYEFELNNTCLAGGWIDPGKSLGAGNDFQQNHKYVIFAFADDDCKDLDIILKDKKGNILKKDESTDNSPMIFFTPKIEDHYYIELKNLKSKEKVFCTFAIMQKGSNNYESINRLKHSYKRFTELGTSFSGKYNFVSDWCLIGGMYSEGRSDGFYGDKFDVSRDYTFFVAGSYNVEDVDCEIIEQFDREKPTGTTIFKDESKSSTAICTAYLNAGKYYYFKFLNYHSDGDGFILGGMMYK